MKIVVTPQELISTAGTIEGMAADYNQLYTLLFADVSALQNGWQGKDNLAFTNQIEGFRDNFQNMQALMEDYATFLRTSATNYTNTQDAVASAASKLVN